MKTQYSTTKTIIAACALVAMAGNGEAQTPISWAAAQNINNASDVANNGTFFDAVTTLGNSCTANGVTFNSFNGVVGSALYFNDTFNNITLTLPGGGPVYGSVPAGSIYWAPGYNYNGASLLPTPGGTVWIQSYNNSEGAAPGTTDPYYQAIAGSSYYAGLGGVYGVNSTAGGATINLSGLTVGNTYQVQLWSGGWNGPVPSTFSDGLGNSVVLTTGNDSSGFNTTAAALGQYVIGTFTATGATEAIYDNQITPSAISVQVIATPEPSTLALAGLGGLAMLACLRRSAIIAWF